jgi:hypothetical protein
MRLEVLVQGPIWIRKSKVYSRKKVRELETVQLIYKVVIRKPRLGVKYVIFTSCSHSDV